MPSQQRFVGDGLFGLAGDAGPDRVDLGKFCACLSHAGLLV
jgi:hypothetical protein